MRPLVDASGNTITSFSGDISLTFSGLANAPSGAVPTITDKNGTSVNLGNATTITFTSGVSSAGGILVAKKMESPTLHVTDGTYSDTSAGGLGLSLTVSAGTASVLLFTTQPSGATAGSAFTAQPVVKTCDAYQNLSTVGLGATVNVTIAIKTGTGSLQGTTSYNIGTSGGNGTITGSGLRIDQAGSFTLSATATSFTEGDSSSFTVSPLMSSVAASSTLSAAPGSVTADGSTTATITLTLKDSYNNPIAGKSVSIAQTSGAGSPTITTVLNVTDASGHGSWTVKSTTAATDGFTATDTTDPITVTQTASVTFTAGNLHHYAVTFSASPAYASTPFVTTVTAQDINNNTVTTANTTVVMSSTAAATMMYENLLEPGHYYYQADNIAYRTRTLSSGVATLNMQDTATGTGITVTATDGTITGTATIDISTLVGAYRTWGTGGGARDWAGTTTWQINNSPGGWQDTSTPPGDTTHAPISILSGDTVTVAASSVTANEVHVTGQLTISNGKTLTIQTGSGESTALSGMQVHGTVTVASDGTLTIATGDYESEVQVFAGGVLESAGTINSTSGTLDFEPGSPGGKYRHLYATTGGTIPSATWDPGAVCEIAGYTSNTGTPSGLNQSFSTFTWNCTSQAADINLGGSQFTTLDTFNVASTGSKSITLGANLTLTNTATVSSGAALYCADKVISQASGGSASYFDLQPGGTLGVGALSGLSAAGTSGNIQTTTHRFSSGANYVYNGSAVQNTGNGLPSTVSGLTVNNSAGVNLTASLTVNSALTLTVGQLIPGANQLSLATAATWTRTGGWVNGAVVKTFATGSSQSFTFPIGGSTHYRPVALASLNVTSAGTLAAIVTASAGNHPQIATSGINPAHEVDRYWTLTPGSGLAVGTYDATFNFDASDVSSGADTGEFVVREYSTSAWSAPTTGTRTSTSTAATGLSAFGDFIIGDPLASRMIVTLPGQTFTSGIGNSGTVNSQIAGSSFDITLTAVDIFNTIAPDYAGLTTITYSGPANSPSGAAPVYTTAVTFTAGQAASVATTLKRAETTTITATDDVLTGVASSSLTVNVDAVSASASTVSASPTSVVADGTTTSGVTATLKDASGNPVSGKGVSLRMTTGSGSPIITTVQGTTDSSGVATFTVACTKAEAETFTAQDTTDSNLDITQTATVTFTPGALHQFAITPNPITSGTAGTAITGITITAQDANGNTVTTFAGSVTYNGTAGVTGNSGTFILGVLSSVSITSTKAGSGLTFTVADANSHTGSTTITTLNPAAFDHYAVTFSAPPFYAGVTFTTYVTAQDVYNNTVTSDVTYSSGTVSFSSTSGTMQWDGNRDNTWSKVSPENETTLTNGVASIPTGDSVAHTGVIVTASANTKTANATIDITTQADSYRTKASGTWADYATVWEMFDGANWIDATASPSSANGVITIQSGHTVYLDAGVSVDQTFVNNGGALVINGDKTLTVVSTTYPGLVVFGSLVNSGTVTVNSSASVLVFGTYQHNHTVDAGTIPAATWETGSTCEIIGYNSNTDTPGGLNQSFQNFVWNCPAQTGNISLGSGFTSANNFTVSSTGSGSIAVVLGADLAVANATTIAAGATLYCGAYKLTGSSFTLDAGATLGIGSPFGIRSSAALGTGTITTTSGSATVTGASTAFSTELVAGMSIYTTAGTFIGTVASVETATSLTLSANAAVVVTGVGFKYDDGNIQTTTRNFSLGGNYVYNGTAAQVTGSGLPSRVGDLVIDNSSTGVALSGDVAVAYLLNLNRGALSIGAHTLTLRGDVSISSGTLTGSSSSSLVIDDLSGTAATAALPAISGGLQNLTLNRANGATLNGTVGGISGNLTLTTGTLATDNGIGGSYLTFGNGSTIYRVLGALTGPATVPSGLVNIVFQADSQSVNNNLPVTLGPHIGNVTLDNPNPSAGDVTINVYSSLPVQGNLTINTGAIGVDNGYTIAVWGNVINNGVLVSTSSTGGIRLTNGTANHALSGTGTYGNLELSDAWGATLSAASTLTGKLTLTAGELSGANNLTLATGTSITRASGSLSSGPPTFSGTVNVTYLTGGVAAGTELPTSAGNVLQALSFNNSSGTITLSAAATVNGTLTIASGSTLADGGFTLTAKGDVYNYGTHSGSGKVGLDNPSSQTLFGNGAYGNLELVQGEADLAGSPTINGTLTLPHDGSTGLFDVGANTLTLNGSTIAGTAGNLVADFSSSLVFGGSSTGVQIPSSVTELNGLTINNANGVTLNANLAIGGTLTLTSGVLNAPGYLVDVQNADNGSVIRTGGWLYGTLGKYFAVGTAQSFTFWVGDAGTCRQMSYTMDVTGAGSIRMQLIPGADPQAATSGLNPAKTLPFYWQRIAKGRVAFANLTVIRYFGADASTWGIDYTLLMDRSWSSDFGSWENRPIISRASTSISVYGVVRAPTSDVDSYTDFVDGEQVAGAYQISANTTTPNPGAADQLTITLVDAVGVPVSYTGAKNLTFSGLSASADGTHFPSVTDNVGTARNLSVTTPITFASGVSSVGGSLVAYRPGAQTLNVRDDASTPLSSTSAGGFGVSVNVQNAAPVPAAYPVTRNKGAGVMFKVEDLLKACSDANYDSLSLSSVATSSADGGTVAHNATWILYTPSSSSPDGDTFSYTISDGTTTADGTVTVSVTQPSGQSANMFALTFSSDHPVVSFAGIPGRSYGIQRADSANGSYVTKTTVTVPTTGSPIVTWTDPDVTGDSYFYRTVSNTY